MKNYLIGVLLMTLVGCKGYQHAASPHFTPVFNKEKKEIVATIGSSFYQIGYSLSPHLFLFNTGSYRSKKDTDPFRAAGKENSGGITRKEHSYELDGGVGYVIRAHHKQYSFLLGAGGGKVKSTFEKDLVHNYSAELRAYKMNLFFQPNINFLFTEHTSLSVSTKFSYVQFRSITNNIIPGDLNIAYAEDATLINTNTVPSFFAEPGVAWRIGGERVKFEIQTIAPIKLSNEELRYKKLMINLGLRLNLL